MPGNAGRKPKPPGLRLLEGNREHRPIADVPRPRPIRPSAPRWMDPIAKKEWRGISRKLHRLGILTEIDLTALEAYCVCYSKWRQAEEKAKIEVVETDSGYKAQDPYVGMALKYLKELRSYQLEFGMTPSSRVRVTPYSDMDEVDKDEDLD